jgi:[protein-PII] uridylyltransferase
MDSPASIKKSLSAARAALRVEYAHHPQPRRLLRAHSRLVDEHLIALWRVLDMPATLTLAAAGGYGRGELYPHSDIDLLILLPEPADGALAQRLQELVGTLWDIGLEVGHSIRTVGDCMAESSDVTVQTNLLETRRVAGSAALFDQMREMLKLHLSRRTFYLAKIKEQEQRHARFVDTDFNLEPNLKESPGGLRDLQTVLWISRASGFGDNWKMLAAAGLISADEARAVSRHEALLQTLRIRLHYLSKRQEDRLLFDYQDALAKEMSIASTATKSRSEHLMQRYYRTKQAVLRINAMLLQSVYSRLFPEEQAAHPLNERFVVRDGHLLEAKEEDLFERHPQAILEGFLLMEQHPELTRFSAPTVRALWRAHRLIDAAFRRDPANRALFMQILRQPQGITHVLRRMSRQGVLGRYLPPFGRISGQLQHDLVHVYTVDEHILMVVHNLRCFMLPKHAHEFPLCNRLMADFARPEVLYIAGLFHDIAKGRGGDHSIKGKPDALRFCRDHGLMKEDRELVAWLVEYHLAMSSTAQRQDLSDQNVIGRFAANIPNERYLVALYLLTVADIRATSPKLWNAWKGKLLEDLFHATRRYMAGGKIADQAGEIRARAKEQLNLYAIDEARYELLWAQLDTNYFLRHEPHEIAWHTRQLAWRANSEAPIVKTRLSRIGEGLQVMVYCTDRPYLFERICTFFARLHYNIVQANIHTTLHGYALDSFMVMAAGDSREGHRDAMAYIEHELAAEIARNDIPSAPRFGRISRQLKHFPLEPSVRVVADEKNRHILNVVAGDRPGLLARIAHVLARHHIDLQNAKINTLGGRAEDTFWVTGEALNNPEAAESLREELLRQVA